MDRCIEIKRQDREIESCDVSNSAFHATPFIFDLECWWLVRISTLKLRTLEGRERGERGQKARAEVERSGSVLLFLFISFLPHVEISRSVYYDVI